MTDLSRITKLLPGLALAVLSEITMAAGYNPDAVLCPLNEYIDDEDQTVREYFECPGPEDPEDFTVSP